MRHSNELFWGKGVFLFETLIKITFEWEGGGLVKQRWLSCFPEVVPYY
jgi:hypothetical protein